MVVAEGGPVIADLVQGIQENRDAPIFRFNDDCRIRSRLLRRDDFKFGLVPEVAVSVVLQSVEAKHVPLAQTTRKRSPRSSCTRCRQTFPPVPIL